MRKEIRKNRMYVTWLSILVTLGLLSVAGPLPQRAQAQSPPEPAIQSDEKGLTLTWTPPPYTVDVMDVDGAVYSVLQMPYTTPSGQPGHPQLPLYSGFIGLPATGDAQLREVELQVETAQLPHLPVPAPAPVWVHVSPETIDPLAFGAGGPTVRAPDATAYATDAFYPDSVAQLGPVQHVRGQRIAALTVYPLRVNPVSRQLEVMRYLRLEISFTEPAQAAAVSGQQVGPDAFNQALTATLLNPDAAKWSPAAAPDPAPEPPLAALATAGEIKVVVGEAGLYMG